MYEQLELNGMAKILMVSENEKVSIYIKLNIFGKKLDDLKIGMKELGFE